MQPHTNAADRFRRPVFANPHPIARRDSLARLAPYLLVALTVAGGILRIHAIASKGLWLDEAFSVWLADQSLGALLAWLLRIDQHPPLYYAALHSWVALFGHSASSVRLLSAIFGTLTIPVIYLLGRRLLGIAGGLLAATILTVSPFHVRFAQETRMYTLLTLNASLALFCLAVILTDPRAHTTSFGAQLAAYARSWQMGKHGDAVDAPGAPPGDTANYRDREEGVAQPALMQPLPLSTAATDLAWLGLIFFTAATVLSHNTAVLFPIATNVFVLGFIFWQRRSGEPAHALTDASGGAHLTAPTLRNWLGSQAAALLLWSPWLAAFVIQAIGVYGEFWIQRPTALSVAATIGAFFSAHFPTEAEAISPVIAGGFGLLVALGVIYLRRRVSLLAFLTTMAAVPFIGELLVSLRRPIFYDRTLIWTTIPLFLLLAAGLLQLRYRPGMIAGLAFIVAVNGISLHQYYSHFEKEQWREAAVYVGEQVREGDLLLFNATWVQIPFDFYFRGQDRQVEERGAPVDLFDRGILEPKMAPADLPRLRDLIRGRDRVWLIYSHNWYTDPQSLIPTALGEELRLLDRRPFVGLDVRLYGAPH